MGLGRPAGSDDTAGVPGGWRRREVERSRALITARQAVAAMPAYAMGRLLSQFQKRPITACPAGSPVLPGTLRSGLMSSAPSMLAERAPEERLQTMRMQTHCCWVLLAQYHSQVQRLRRFKACGTCEHEVINALATTFPPAIKIVPKLPTSILTLFPAP